jgi:hypothetical protein
LELVEQGFCITGGPAVASCGDAVDSLMRGGTLRRTGYDLGLIQRKGETDVSGARSMRPAIDGLYPRT